MIRNKLSIKSKLKPTTVSQHNPNSTTKPQTSKISLLMLVHSFSLDSVKDATTKTLESNIGIIGNERNLSRVI